MSSLAANHISIQLTTSEGGLVEVYLTREEMASPILIIGLTNVNWLWKMKPILESTHGVSI